MSISGFFGRYRFLSNFYPCRVKLNDIWYPTVENAYQAAKVPIAFRTAFSSCTPGEAKKLGRQFLLPSDWESRKLEIMKDLVRQKFSRSSVLGKLLLQTWGEELIESNSWNDQFWGVCRGKGKNHLGRIIMEVRLRLKEER